MIIKNKISKNFSGCDCVVMLDGKDGDRAIKLLQLTDMQFIDSSQSRKADRLKPDEVKPWAPENFDLQCGNQIRTLVAQCKPDVIFITGDMVYGEFDDNGSVFTWFCKFMDQFEIPWAPVFGNHDNESAKGVQWQCEQLENSKYCLFKRGCVSGNGNYVVGIARGEKLVNLMYMLDSNGCSGATDCEVIKTQGIFPDQIEFIKKRAREIEETQGRKIPSIVAFHIPTDDFVRAEEEKGYKTEERCFYNIGVDVDQRGEDFGCKYEKISPIVVPKFSQTLKEINAKGVFAGHYHCVNTCISYDRIKWVFGLKTGQYDYHNPSQLGGTLIRANGENLEVNHLKMCEIKLCV